MSKSKQHVENKLVAGSDSDSSSSSYSSSCSLECDEMGLGLEFEFLCARDRRSHLVIFFLTCCCNSSICAVSSNLSKIGFYYGRVGRLP